MVDRWTKKIDNITTDFINKFGKLNFEQLNKKPDSNSWSIGQVINHLIITNQTYYPIIESVRKGSFKKPLTARIGFLVNFFGKLVLNTVQPDTTRKAKTFNIWQPPLSDIPADILDKFKKHQSEFKNKITECEDLINQDTVIYSPANKFIVYKLDTAFDILVAHEQRHYRQAERVFSLFNFQ